MTGFLASVKNIDEAKKICLSTADIIDFKKVNDGALGFVGSNIVCQGRKVLQDRIISVTMGNEHNPNNNKKLFDLRKFVTDKLLKFKVKVDHVDKDTFAQKSNFFSYRRSRKLEEKDYGRCISTVSMP